jgi:hypothetical protein
MIRCPDMKKMEIPRLSTGHDTIFLCNKLDQNAIYIPIKTFKSRGLACWGFACVWEMNAHAWTDYILMLGPVLKLV